MKRKKHSGECDPEAASFPTSSTGQLVGNLAAVTKIDHVLAVLLMTLVCQHVKEIFRWAWRTPGTTQKSFIMCRASLATTHRHNQKKTSGGWLCPFSSASRLRARRERDFSPAATADHWIETAAGRFLASRDSERKA